jgi:hypothetical protein
VIPHSLIMEYEPQRSYRIVPEVILRNNTMNNDKFEKFHFTEIMTFRQPMYENYVNMEHISNKHDFPIT